jgi:pimeloyl-ACP methyl ester carboxylesterase
VDNRDVGQSSYAAGPYTIGDLAGDVAGLLERLRLPPAHVVGLSMGGMIAQELALAAPERVRSLVLLSTLARADEWFRRTLAAFGLIRRQVADTAAFFDVVLPWWVSHRFCEDSERPAWLSWLLRRNPHPQRLDGFLRQLDALGRHDAHGRLHALRCPVLIVAGEDDSIAPPRYSRDLLREIPHARLAVLPGIGHAPPLEDPGLLNRHLADFLNGQGPLAREP